MLLTGFVSILLAAAGDSDSLRATIERVAREAQGRVGAAVVVLESGDSVAINEDQRFPMQSVYKLPIAMAVLNDVDRGALDLDRKVTVARRDLVPSPAHSPIRDKHPGGGVNLGLRELLWFAIVQSDGTASDVLLRIAGGPERVTNYLRKLGVQGVVVATSEAEMTRGEGMQYRNAASPNGVIALLRLLQKGQALSMPSRVLLQQFLIETDTGPNRIKGLLPAGTVVAHKTGTSQTVNGLTRATNDVGIVTLPDGRHMAVAIFVADSTANVTVRENVIARITRAAWDHWAEKSQ
jgi:beta-lactamase class A